MALDILGILDRIESHARATGYFQRVNKHEPKSAPGQGLTCSIWASGIAPVASSGLDSTSVRLEFTVRLMQNFVSEPEDLIDSTLITALDVLFRAYSGDFSFGASVRHVDLIGAEGAPLEARAGYVNQDNKNYRIFDITLPVIVNDVWEQEA